MTQDLFSTPGLSRGSADSDKQDKAAKKAAAVERTRVWRIANAEKYKADGAAYREKKRQERPVDPELAVIAANIDQAPEEYRAMPRTIQEAEAAGAKQYFTGQACPKGHIGPRYTKKRACVQCSIDGAMKRHYRPNQSNHCGAANCPAAKLLYWHFRYATTKVLKGREHLKGPRNGNHCGKRRCPAARPLNRLLHYEANRETYYAAAAGRRGRMRHGCPPEYRDELNRIYAECPPGHVVDHIVPMNGKRVSGLHVPWNLQHLTIAANKKKSARFDEADGIDYTAPAWRTMA